LNDHGFLTSRLFKTGSGNPFLEFDGKPVYLKQYIDGTVEETYSLDMAHQVGAALAELHAIQPPENLPDRFAYGIECFDQVLGGGTDFSRWLAAHLGQIETSCHPDLPTGLIHGDLFYDNTLFQGGRLAAILDFEEACNYYLVFDLGMCAAGSCCIAGRLSLELTAALVAGYQDTRRLTVVEQELFQLHIFYGAAATAFWRFRQYNMIHPEAGRQDNFVPMQELADQVRDIAPSTFKQAVFG
jgi:homoserine kinase type II